MPNYVTQMSKDSGGAYLVKDTAARQQISDEVTTRESAIANEASTREAEISALKSTFAEEFDSTKAYKNGEYVLSPTGELYRFVMDKPAGVWDSGYAILAVLCNEENSDFLKNKELANSQIYEIGTFYSYIPYTITEGVYDWNGNLNTAIIGGNHLHCWVLPNHKYRISGRRWAKSYPAVIYLNDNNIIGYENIHVATDTRFTNIDIVTPADCNNIYVNGLTAGYADGSPFIKDIQPTIKLNDRFFAEQQYTIETGVYDLNYSLNSAVGVHVKIPVNSGDIIKFSAYKFANSYPIILTKQNGQFTGYSLGDSDASTRYQNYYTVIQPNVDELIVQCDDALRIDVQKAIPVSETSSWNGKNILWLGTSISATGATFRNAYYTIPGYACRLLGANAMIEAKGESMARNGYEFAVSSSDPYGWTGAYWNNIAYSLSMTLAEKNELINNWESKWRDLLIGENKPQTLTDEIKAQWRGCSYESRLLPYLTGERTKPDLIVIEHGRNDVAFFNQSADDYSGIPSVNPDALSGYNRSLYGDAMAFLIRVIREHMKHVPIMIIGHFDNSGSFINVPTEQEKSAKYNGVYFCDTTPTGWNDCKVTVTGHFVDGYWVEDGVQRVTCYRNANLADTIHPASTLSGEPIMIEAGIIANYILSNITP